MATKKIKMVTVLGALVTPEFAQQNLAKASYDNGIAQDVLVEVDELVHRDTLIGARLDSHKYELVQRELSFEQKMMMVTRPHVATIERKLDGWGVDMSKHPNASEDVLLRLIEIFLETERCFDFNDMVLESARDCEVDV